MPRVAHLSLSEHGAYRRAAGGPGSAVRWESIDTNARHRPFVIVMGVPIDHIADPRIVAVRGRREALHVLMTLLTGERAACWDRRFVRECWRLGFTLELHVEMTLEIAERMRLRSQSTLGYPRVHELPGHGRPST